ncbi:MAG TPA: hypothetical protein VH593_02340 [Ktedonobacteraceae bacterium]|jgi:hypothetical protein
MNQLVPRPQAIEDIPGGGPTYDGFVAWVTAVMGIPTGNMPDDATLQVAYNEALNLAYLQLACIPSVSTTMSIYAMAVYNLGGAILVEIAQDAQNQSFWADLRNKFQINSMLPGFITQAHDQGTGEGMYIIKQLEGMTLFGLQLMKTPWGRMYLMIAGQWGTLWGLTI